MAAITSPINVGMPNLSRRSYISTGTFHTDIFRYTTSVNASLQTVGTLTSLSSVGTGTAANCPINRVVRENGRRLFPDANPGVSGLLVGVYDAISGLSGFIDPNSSKFVLMSSDRANYLADPLNPVSGYKDALVRSATVLPITVAATASIDANLAQTFTLTTTTQATVALSASAVPPAGSLTYLIVTNGASNGTSGSFTATATTITFVTNPAVVTGTNTLGGGFREAASLVTSTVTGDIYVMTFISDGTRLIEAARSGTVTAGGARTSADATAPGGASAAGGGGT